MNTLEIKEPVPETAAGPAAITAPAPASATESQAAPPAVTTPAMSPPRPSGLGGAGFSGVIGKVDVLSAKEEERLGVCEGAIQTGWRSFVDIGVPLAEIRDG